MNRFLYHRRLTVKERKNIELIRKNKLNRRKRMECLMVHFSLSFTSPLVAENRERKKEI